MIIRIDTDKKLLTIEQCKSLNELLEFVSTNQHFKEYEIKTGSVMPLGSNITYRDGIIPGIPNNSNWTDK